MSPQTAPDPELVRFYEEAERNYRALDLDVPAALRFEQAEALLAAGLADEAAAHLDDVLPVLIEEQSISKELARAELYRIQAIRDFLPHTFICIKDIPALFDVGELHCLAEAN